MSGGDGKGHNSGAHATGGVKGTSGKGGPSSGKGVDASDHSGWSSENNGWSKDSGIHWGGGSGNGNGGGSGKGKDGKPTGWGWTSTTNPDVPPYVDANGDVRITITNGLVKTPVYGTPSPGGKSDVQGGHIPANPKDKLATKWDKNNLPKEIDVTVDEYKYRVTLDNNGNVTGIKRTAIRPLKQWENGKAAIMKKVEHKNQEEIYNALKINDGESQRESKAKKEAKDAWNKLPPNVRSFTVNVEEYHYSVTLDDYGSVTGIKRTAIRPLKQWENGKAAIMKKVEHKNQEEIYNALKINDGESERENKAKKAAQEVFNSFSMNRDRVQSDVLNKTAEIISDMGEKVGKYLGDKYKAVAKEIADDIKNFQGKTFRTHEQAMASMNKILANPGMKVNKGDKDALVNVWKSFKASDTAKKLGNLSRAFKVADIALKAEKVREKSIEGYETGNWGPLMREVESWVVGGLAARVALGLFSAILGTALLSAGVPATVVGIMGIIVAGTVAVLVGDDKVVNKLNNEIIRPAH